MHIDEYELFGLKLYERFSAKVLEFLKKAIEEDKGYHLWP